MYKCTYRKRKHKHRRGRDLKVAHYFNLLISTKYEKENLRSFYETRGGEHFTICMPRSERQLLRFFVTDEYFRSPCFQQTGTAWFL